MTSPLSPVQEPSLLGHWRTSNGYLFCGSLRIARADFDTNPATHFRDQILNEICNAMNGQIKRFKVQAEKEKQGAESQLMREYRDGSELL